ncbi:DNA-directed RNA polymerase II core subunit rpb9 [Saitoella coloradoensis]
MPAVHYCQECNNILHPLEDKLKKRLLLHCRRCGYTENAEDPTIFRQELRSTVADTAGVTTDLGSDPTLPRSDQQCPKCGEKDAVFFQSQAKRADAKMTLYYVCVSCANVFEDSTQEGYVAPR